MTATAQAERKKKEQTAEQKLRSEITALDRKIEAQRVRIEKLTGELAEKKAERASLVRQRIELLTAELPEEPDDASLQ